VTTASWVPAWYELDQSISVGVVDKFGFALRRRPADDGVGLWVFAAGLAESSDIELRHVMIRRIEHPALGELRGVDAWPELLQRCAQEGGGSSGNAPVCGGRACLWAAAHGLPHYGMASAGGGLARNDRDDFAVRGRAP
jgi:hypothetical protein